MIKTFPENIAGKVWFVDVVTEYGIGHYVPAHITIERCAESLNANYIAVVDQDCPVFIGTEKWQRVFDNSTNLHFRLFAQFAKTENFIELL
jgi:hypothetical protein